MRKSANLSVLAIMMTLTAAPCLCGDWNPRLNKKYEPDSMPARFMLDAASAFATLALLDAEFKN